MAADEPADESTTPAEKKPQRWWIRLVLAVLLFAGFWGVGRATGLTDDLSTDSVREMVAGAGAWGFLLYVAVFAGGELIHIPGIVFVGAAALAWGGPLGYGLALFASVVSVCVSFVVVRTVGGRALTGIQRPWVEKMLARLDARPITTIVLLRLVLWLAPPLNYALAMTDVRFRDYLIGSTIGLVLPVLGMSVFFELLL